jgi:hypothetical protein
MYHFRNADPKFQITDCPGNLIHLQFEIWNLELTSLFKEFSFQSDVNFNKGAICDQAIFSRDDVFDACRPVRMSEKGNSPENPTSGRASKGGIRAPLRFAGYHGTNEEMAHMQFLS